MSNAPTLSLIIPAYQSGRTIAQCLRTLQSQSFQHFEVIVVDSSPNGHTRQIMQAQFPHVIYRHSSKRLLPYAARNRAVELAQGRLLAFTDPDIYAHSDWLDALIATYRKRGGAVAGAIDCYGRKPVEMGMHYCKFDKWLPGGDVRPIDIGATANFLCDRDAFEAVGGFDESSMLGDTLMSWAFAKEGIPIWFDPNAVVEHHHTGTWVSLLRERHSRGRDFGELRLRLEGWSRLRTMLQALMSLVPIRLTKLTLRGIANARRSRQLSDFLQTSPVVISGQAAWLAGETAAYWHQLRGNRPSP